MKKPGSQSYPYHKGVGKRAGLAITASLEQARFFTGIESPYEPWPGGVEAATPAIAELRGVDERTVLQRYTRNSAKLFGLSQMA